MKVKNSLPFLFIMFIANCVYHWRTLSRILKCVGARGKVELFGLDNGFYVWVKLGSGLDIEWSAARGWVLDEHYISELEVKRDGGCVVVFNPEAVLRDLEVVLKGVSQEDVKAMSIPVKELVKTYYEGEKR